VYTHTDIDIGSLWSPAANPRCLGPWPIFVGPNLPRAKVAELLPSCWGDEVAVPAELLDLDVARPSWRWRMGVGESEKSGKVGNVGTVFSIFSYFGSCETSQSLQAHRDSWPRHLST